MGTMTVYECIHGGLSKLLSSPPRLSTSVKVEVKPGRFKGEYNIIYYNDKLIVLTLKVFCGRGYYRGWVEVFNVDPEFFSIVEDEVYNVVSQALRPGEPLYIDYSWDTETIKLLDIGAPAQLTRIGLKLVERGFTWFKVWYYPEGFMEGNVKIQAEKPVNSMIYNMHRLELCKEIKEFIDKWSRGGDRVVMLALERAHILASSLKC